MKVGVLGPLEVLDDQRAIEISGSRLRLLLALLALEAPKAVSATALVDALWGDDPPADETNALQSLVSRLRKALGHSDLVLASPAGYRLAVDATDIDLHRFEQLTRDGRAALKAHDPSTATTLLTDALDLWRGDPTEIAASDHAPALLARLEEQHLDARADLIEARLALGRADDVIADLEGLVAQHPLRQRFSVLLIQALHAAGRDSEALASFERAKTTLVDELGVDPSAELQAAHLAVLQGEPAAPLAPTPARRNNLRATLTSFVGRDDQLVQIGSLLATGRLVTLVGPGGAGKTRLAGAAATAAATDLPDGIWLAELAPVTDPADVPQTVLGSLGLRDAILLERSGTMTPRDATSRLIAALADRSAVLVLDNCEHLIDAAAHLADQLLAQCPQLRILATSREPLGIFGESLVVVPPLGQPEANADAKTALKYPAVQLFADRAVDVQPSFEVDDATVASVIEIVRRLDGLPLAIELAAARLRTLSVAEIERRLSDRFRLLTGGSRTAMPRHRTLRAVVEWSWDLLTEAEQLVAERLAVFSGGVTPGAASAVCAGADLSEDAVDDLLTSLVDKSLLQSIKTPDARPRYRMLETIREFGLERMAERHEVGRVRLAHAEHFAALVTAADPKLRSADQLEWMAVLAIERDNILAALKFFGDDGRADAAIDLVNLLGWYWMTIGNHGEIVTWISFVLGVPGATDSSARLLAEAYLAVNGIAWDDMGTADDIETGLQKLAEVSRKFAAAPPGGPKMMTLLGPIIAMFSDDPETAATLTDRALRDDDPWIAAAVRTFRASMAENNGDVKLMRDDAETALATFRELGERWGMANSLQVLGQLELVEGNLESAAAAYREGVELAHAIGSREDVAMMRLRLADILARLGDADGAREQAALAEEDAELSGSPVEVLFAHVVRVEIARSCGDSEAAQRFAADGVEKLRSLPSLHPIRSHGLASLLATVSKIHLEAGDLVTSYDYLVEAYDLALLTKDMPIVASVAVAYAMYVEHTGDAADAAEILGAGAQLRGADDVTQSDIIALDRALGGIHDGPHAAAYRAGKSLSRQAALERVRPSAPVPAERDAS